jgi:putative transposase
MFRQRKFWLECEAILKGIAERHGFRLLAVSVMPTTVQLVVVGPHKFSASDFAFLLKGCSARELQEFEPRFRLRYPKGHFWAKGFDAKPVSPLELDNAIKYVLAPHNDPNQKTIGNSSL